jgi:mannose-1-phosphate guanylyltransferase
MNYAIIMAGGSGTRFWPLSRKALPKQFLSLFGGTSLLRQTYERIRPLFPDERIFVITNSRYINLVQAQLPELEAENIIGEVAAKNTAPCVAMAASLIKELDSDAVMAVLPSDHSIVDDDSFREILQLSMNQASATGALFTIGIQPDRPETGYGYIQYDKSSSVSAPVFPVKTFAEKPDLETAKSFLKSGDFLWNSGMFVWRADAIMREFDAHLPTVSNLCSDMVSSLDSVDRQEAIDSFYQSVVSISIDYGIMEKAGDVRVVPADIGWSDVGSWHAAWQLANKDENGNSINGSLVEMVGTKNSYVRNTGDKLIALVGMDDVIVVDTDDAILIMPREKSQEIRDLMDKHLPEHGDKYL